MVIGSGSAGRRHVATLRRALPEHRLTVVRRAGRRGLAAPLDADGIEVTHDLMSAVRRGVYAGVVAGPAPLHLDAASVLVAHGASAVLVEKPLSTDDADVTAWLDPALADRVLVGYHLRFGELLPGLCRLLAAGTIGPIVSFELSVGQHLSTWRPGTDASMSVSARRELGGGVLLELSHELDAVRVLTGSEVTSVASAELCTDGAPTDGNVETVADLDLTMSDGAAGTVHLDMTSNPPLRRWTIRGDHGVLRADLLASTIDLVRPDGSTERLLTAPPGERDRAEVALIDHLLAVAAGTERPRCTIADGLAVLDIVRAARRSADLGRPEPVEPSASEPTSTIGGGA